ncbi:RnfABCDGE type electron transport complex subunit D [Candidatus Microgenomates bacterium]|nr:RnfABCDGE type electron transport complex subunit D [Candidatus Microgenomates bacterium]
MRRLVETPKTQLGIALFLIFITAFINNPSLKIIAIYLFLHFVAVASDLFFLKLRNIFFFSLSASLVSASIITLVVNPNIPWHQLFVIAVLAIASKNFLRVSGRGIFNPAGFGLLAGSLIFPDAISWWGTSFQQFRVQNLESIIFFLILLSPVLISIIRMKRYRIILSFLIMYILLSSISNLLDPTLLFFSLVMLPEPMTTPNRHLPQILFGIFVAVFSFITFLPIQNFQLDPLITSLLIGNLIFFKFR